MTFREKEIIRLFKEKIQLYLERNKSKEYILEWLDNVIYNSPYDFSKEYFSELYKMQEMVLSMND